MTEYVFVYKCRMCGKAVDGGITGNENDALQTLAQLQATGHSLNIGAPILMTSIHECVNGNIGVADLQGYEIRR